jgi:hypothetical protein
MSSRSICIAIAAGATGLLVAGCGLVQHAATAHQGAAAHQGTKAESAQQAIALAADHAAIANSFAATFSMNGTANGSSLDASGTIEEAEKPSLFADMNFTSFTAEGQSIPGGIEEIITSSDLYMRMSSLSQLTGKAWVKIPSSEFSAASGLNLTQLLQQAENSNPLVQTQLLAGATDVRTAGTSVLNGVPVTEYTGTYPMTTAIAHLPASERTQVSQLVEQEGIASVDFKVWLDDQHQVHKMIITEQGSTFSETLTMSVTSINQPLNTTLPPASDTTTISPSELKG